MPTIFQNVRRNLALALEDEMKEKVHENRQAQPRHLD
jgi:uncharacterized protein YqfA (UPF0365 family)